MNKPAFYDITKDPEFDKIHTFILKAEKDTSLLSEEQESRLEDYNIGMTAQVNKMQAITRSQDKKRNSRKKKNIVSKKHQRSLYKCVWMKRMWMKYLVEGGRAPSEYDYTLHLQALQKSMSK